MTAMRIKSTGKKKTYNVEADLIERVRRLFNAKTDTDAIQAALRKAIEDHDIRAVAGPSAQGGSVPHHPPVRYVLDTNLCVEPVRSEGGGLPSDPSASGLASRFSGDRRPSRGRIAGVLA